MKTFDLPSGAKLRIGLAPFADARDLYQSVLNEVKTLKVDDDVEIDFSFLLSIACTLLSSKDVESKMEKCMKKCLYNDDKITNDIFEDEEARQDYLDCVARVIWENIYPFGKAHFSRFQDIFEKMGMGQKQKSATTI